MVPTVYCAVVFIPRELSEVGYLFVKDARIHKTPSKDKHSLAAALAIFTSAKDNA